MTRLRLLRSGARLLLDVIAVVVTVPLAFALRYDGQVPADVAAVIPTLLIVTAVVHLATFLAIGEQNRLWRYTSFREYLQLSAAAVAGTVALIVYTRMMVPVVPLTVVLIHSALSVLALAGLRVARRVQLWLLRRRGQQNGSRQRTLLVGAGDAASALLRDWETHLRPQWEVVGLLDDSPLKRGLRLHGLPVLGPTTELEYIIRRESITHVVIAMPSAQKAVVRSLMGSAQALGATVQVVPTQDERLRSDRSQSGPAAVTLDDLIDSAEVKRTFLSRSRSQRPEELILVTGGAGYIGNHLVRQLLAAGKRVRVLDNFTYGDHALTRFRDDKRLEIIHGDISSIRDVVSATKDATSIIALAAIVGDPACGINAEETLNLNYEATKVLVEAANFYGVQRLVFASSCSVYGAADNEPLSEDSALNPVSLYARTRILSEDVLFDRCGDVEPVVLRLSTVFGLSSRMRFDLVVNAMTARAVVQRKVQVFGGDQWRPFVHCADAALAFMKAVTAPSEAVKGQIFNIGSDNMNFTIAQVAEVVAEVVGPDVQVQTMDTAEDLRNYRVVFEKARTRLAFLPKFDLRSGVREMAQGVGEQDDLRNFEAAAFSNLKVLKDRFVVAS